LPKQLSDIYPDSLHVFDIALAEASDADIWFYAKENGLTLISKDTDFQQRSLLMATAQVYLSSSRQLFYVRYRVAPAPIKSRYSYFPYRFTESHLILHRGDF
jgi:Domain of unknown function (DUF5615)